MREDSEHHVSLLAERIVRENELVRGENVASRNHDEQDEGPDDANLEVSGGALTDVFHSNGKRQTACTGNALHDVHGQLYIIYMKRSTRQNCSSIAKRNRATPRSWEPPPSSSPSLAPFRLLSR